MSALPDCTVVIPTHDRRALLARAVASVAAQRCRPAAIIVVDDASREPVAAADLPAGGVPVTVLRNASGRGGARARNRGLLAARTAVVAFLDDDDAWDPSALERHLQALAADPAAVASVIGRRVDRDGRVFIEVPSEAYAFRWRHHENHWGSFTQIAVRRGVDGRFPLLDPGLRACQDWDYLLRLAARGRIAVAAEPLCTIFFHRGPRITTSRGRSAGFRRFRARHWPGCPPGARRWLLARTAFDRARGAPPPARLPLVAVAVVATLTCDFPLRRRATMAAHFALESCLGHERVEDLRFRWRTSALGRAVGMG